MTQEPSKGGGFEVVEGGSGDPFTTPVDGTGTPTPTQEPTTGSQPGTATPSTAEGTEETLTPEEGQALEEGLRKLGWVKGDEIQERISQAQAGHDRRNAALETQLKNERDARLESEATLRREVQEAKLQGLPEEEREQAQRLFEHKEEQRRVREQAQATDDYFRTVRAYDLSVRYAQYWPGDTDADKRTAAEAALMGCEEVDQMELLAERQKAGYYETLASGGAPAGGPAGKGTKPAGAGAPSDAGGAAPAAKPPEPSTAQTLDAMAGNIKGMFGKPGTLA